MRIHQWVGKSFGPACFTLFLAILAVSSAACDVSFQPDPNDGGGDEPDLDNPEPIADSVELRLLNLTSSALRAQIYIGTNGPDETPASLFVSANLYTERIGLAASGLIAPAGTDSAEIDCVDGLVIGTDGGRFLDVETGQELGTGEPRLLSRGFVFDCDDEITLIYRFTNGGYQVDVNLE